MRNLKPYARIESDLFHEDVEISELSGREALSELFELDITLVTRSLLAADELIAGSATLIFELRDEEEGGVTTELRRIHGCFASVRDLMLLNREFRSYRVRFVPRLWRTSLIETLDIFMGMTIGDIITRKLSLSGLEIDEDFQLRLMQKYPEREFVVQYKETDHQFIARLCEHNGIAYAFEHSADKDIVIFSDDNDGFSRLTQDRIPFSRRGEATGIYRLEQLVTAVPSTFIQRDYNYRNPATDLTAMQQIDGGVGGGVVEYGGHFRSEQEGAYLAALRSQEAKARHVRFEGTSDHPGLRAGGTFTVTDHPSGDAPLLLTEVRHELRQQTMLHQDLEGTQYRATFTAIAEGVTYRPPRRTPKPRISGFVTGIVDAEAPSDTYAKVDDHGRYRIRFMFDTSDSADGKASRPLRMMQPHTGAGYGMHFPLRPNTEVMISFMDGDPDRPIIAGAVPNPQTASPVTAMNATRNVIRTGGGNEINIDDTSGDERIKLTTPANNTSFHLGAANNPERGAMLQTAGAMSTIASAGVTRAGGVAATFSTIAELVHSTNIVAEAGFPSGIEMAVQANAVAQFAMNVANAALDEALLQIQVEEAEANTAAVRAATAAEAAQSECQRCLQELNQALDKYLADNSITCTTGMQNPPSACQLLFSLQDYQAKVDAADAAYLGLLGVMEDRNGIITANREGTNTHFEVVMQNDVEAALLAYDASLYESYAAEEDERAWQALLRGAEREDNPLSIPLMDGTDPRGPANKAAWITARHTLRRQQAEDANDGSFNALGDVSTARADLLVKITAANIPEDNPLLAKIDCVTTDDCCGAKLRQARLHAFNTNEAYADLLLENTEEIHDLTDKKLELANWVDRADLASMSLTAVVALTTYVRSRTVRKNLRKFYNGARDLVNTAYQSAGVANQVPPEIETTRAAVAASGTFMKPQYTHVVGSDASTLMYGKRDATVLGKTAMLLGVGTADDDLVVKGLKAKAAAVVAALAIGGGAAAAGATSGYAPTGGALAGLTTLATLYGLLSAKTEKAVPAEGMACVVGAQCAALLSPQHTHVVGGESLGMASKVVGINAEKLFIMRAAGHSFMMGAPNAGGGQGAGPGLGPPGAQGPGAQQGPGVQGPGAQQGPPDLGGMRMVVRAQDGVHGMRLNQQGVRLVSAPVNAQDQLDEKHVGPEARYAQLHMTPMGTARLLAGNYGLYASAERRQLQVGVLPWDEKGFGGLSVSDEQLSLGLVQELPLLECGRQQTILRTPGSVLRLTARGVRTIASTSQFGNALLIKDRADTPSQQKGKSANQKQKQQRAKIRVDPETRRQIQEFIDESDSDSDSDDSDSDVFFDCPEYNGPPLR